MDSSTPKRGSDGDLVATVTKIIERIASAKVADATARYDLGIVVHMVRYATRPIYGPHACAEIAQRLRVDPSGLRRYARVAEVIRPDEFLSYMNGRSPSGWPIGWAHLEKLSQVRTMVQRAILADLVLRDDLSVRSLDALVRAARPGLAVGSGSPKPPRSEPGE